MGSYAIWLTGPFFNVIKVNAKVKKIKEFRGFIVKSHSCLVSHFPPPVQSYSSGAQLLTLCLVSIALKSMFMFLVGEILQE